MNELDLEQLRMELASAVGGAGPGIANATSVSSEGTIDGTGGTLAKGLIGTVESLTQLPLHVSCLCTLPSALDLAS